MATMANRPANMPPTIAPVLDFDVVPPVSGDETPLDDDAVGDVDELVADGAFETETGEFAFKQVTSSDAPTCLTSELPPLRPCESLIVNMIEVPAATSAIQSNDAGPDGGLRIKDSPPGITP